MIQKQAIINDNMRQKQTVVQEDNMEQEQYSASVKVEDTEERQDDGCSAGKQSDAGARHGR